MDVASNDQLPDQGSVEGSTGPPRPPSASNKLMITAIVASSLSSLECGEEAAKLDWLGLVSEFPELFEPNPNMAEYELDRLFDERRKKVLEHVRESMESFKKVPLSFEKLLGRLPNVVGLTFWDRRADKGLLLSPVMMKCNNNYTNNYLIMIYLLLGPFLISSTISFPIRLASTWDVTTSWMFLPILDGGLDGSS